MCGVMMLCVWVCLIFLTLTRVSMVSSLSLRNSILVCRVSLMHANRE